MSAKGLQLPYDGHLVQLLTPVDQQGSARTSLVCRMQKYKRATVIVSIGTAPRAAGVIKIESCDNMTPSTATSIPFTVFKCETGYASANGDLLGAAVACTAAAGLIPAAGTPNGVMYVIEFGAYDLVSGDIGFRVNMADPGAASVLSAVAILSGGTATAQSATVIA